MAKRVFFSFHYQDVIDFRANVVRQHWVTKLNRDEAGFFDNSLWEETKRRGSPELKRLINCGLEGTSVTCVLIGSETYRRPWVRYEIMKSFLRGNHLVAVHINTIRGKDTCTKVKGPNPLEYLGITFACDGKSLTLWELVGSVWNEYQEIDSKSTFRWSGVDPKHHGNGYRLSEFYCDYDWVQDDGYTNFANWVG